MHPESLDFCFSPKIILEWVGRNLWRSPGPTPLLKQGQCRLGCSEVLSIGVFPRTEISVSLGNFISNQNFFCCNLPQLPLILSLCPSGMSKTLFSLSPPVRNLKMAIGFTWSLLFIKLNKHLSASPHRSGALISQQSGKPSIGLVPGCQTLSYDEDLNLGHSTPD